VGSRSLLDGVPIVYDGLVISDDLPAQPVLGGRAEHPTPLFKRCGPEGLDLGGVLRLSEVLPKGNDGEASDDGVDHSDDCDKESGDLVVLRFLSAGTARRRIAWMATIARGNTTIRTTPVIQAGTRAAIQYAMTSLLFSPLGLPGFWDL
jgi:hypothetical protein